MNKLTMPAKSLAKCQHITVMKITRMAGRGGGGGGNLLSFEGNVTVFLLWHSRNESDQNP